MTGLIVLVLFSFIPGRRSALCEAASIQRRQDWPDPDPKTRTPEECTRASFTNPTWGIYDPNLVVVNSSSGGTQGDIRFLTVNSATGVSAECKAKDIDLDPRGPAALETWHNCSIPNLAFQFNLETLDMRLKGSWLCDSSSRFVMPSFSSSPLSKRLIPTGRAWHLRRTGHGRSHSFRAVLTSGIPLVVKKPCVSWAIHRFLLV
jgi:hypothetical protein